MRRVNRFGLVPGLTAGQQNAVISACVSYEYQVRLYRGREVWDARFAAKRHRELLAAFCTPLARALDLNTAQFEERSGTGRSSSVERGSHPNIRPNNPASPASHRSSGR